MLCPATPGHPSQSDLQKKLPFVSEWFANSFLLLPLLPGMAMAVDPFEFRDGAESGIISIDSHEKLLRIAYIYWHIAEGAGGVFDAVDKLHERGWSFGQDELKFNRYDRFYSRFGTFY